MRELFSLHVRRTRDSRDDCERKRDYLSDMVKWNISRAPRVCLYNVSTEFVVNMIVMLTCATELIYTMIYINIK